MYRADPSWTPIADTITDIFNKASAKDKIPYSLCVIYLMMIIFSIKVKIMPIKVPSRTIVVPAATLNKEASTISAMFP